MKKALILFYLFASCMYKAQDPTFNNTQNSLVYLNPSFSGSNHGVRNQTVYRNQWPNLSGAYLFFNTSCDGYIKPINAGVSLSFYSANIGRGLIKQNRLSFAYAQYFSARNSDLKIIPSVQFNYGTNNLRSNYLAYPNQSYPQYGLSPKITSTPNGSVNYYDLSAGLLLYSGGVYFGAAVFNILQPNISFAGIYKVPPRVVIHASKNMAFSRNLRSNLFASYSAQGDFNSTNVKVMNIYKDELLYGLGYTAYLSMNLKFIEFFNNNNNICFYAGLRKGPFSIIYNYDVPVGKLFGNTYGSHELSFSLAFRKKEEEKKRQLYELERY